MPLNNDFPLLLLLVLAIEVPAQDSNQQQSAELASHSSPQAVHIPGLILGVENGGSNDTTESTETDLEDKMLTMPQSKNGGEENKPVEQSQQSAWTAYGCCWIGRRGRRGRFRWHQRYRGRDRSNGRRRA